MYYVSVIFCIIVYAYLCKTNSVPWRDSYQEPFNDNKGFTIISLLFCITFLSIPFINIGIIILMFIINVVDGEYAPVNSIWEKLQKLLNKRLL